ncbi:hypothetical protein [Endozoicomonas lisbonensis]|uniref:Protein kinase domain-containing protein n=1 Tax=Endozoicomonas lisbonensis TaxID=3120522 RepID=A0ABV2SIJ0_9GAMM
MPIDSVTFRNKKFYSKKIKPYTGKENIHSDNKIYESMYSRVYMHERSVYKTVKVSNFIRDNFRLLTYRSKSYDEIKGNIFLSKLGIRVHNIQFWGVAPLSRDVNELLITEKLESYLPIEHHTKLFRENKVIEKILIDIANDINLMAENGAIYRDLHFQNVMSTELGEICWIDTALKYIRSYHKIEDKLRVKVKVLKKDLLDTGKLTKSEWEIFYDTLKYGK